MPDSPANPVSSPAPDPRSRFPSRDPGNPAQSYDPGAEVQNAALGLEDLEVPDVDTALDLQKTREGCNPLRNKSSFLGRISDAATGGLGEAKKLVNQAFGFADGVFELVESVIGFVEGVVSFVLGLPQFVLEFLSGKISEIVESKLPALCDPPELEEVEFDQVGSPALEDLEMAAMIQDHQSAGR